MDSQTQNNSSAPRCAWCNNELTPGEATKNGRIAQSLCPACAEHFVFQMGVPLQKYLDSLPAPIFVVTGNTEVQAANTLGLQLLNKESQDVLRKLSGIVFECAYARLPEGCGSTVHCSGCAIRRSVYETYETGESRINVPATLACDPNNPSQDVVMMISTEKMGDVVLLRIDKICAPAGAC